MSAEPRAALVMDVDGVVSPVHGRTDWGDDVVAGRMFGDVYVSPEMCIRLDRIATTPGLCTVWLTAWDADMRAALDPFPGRRWSEIERPGSGHDGAPEAAGWWKAAALLDWLNTRPLIRTLVWADDHLGKPYDRALLADDTSFGAPTRSDVLTQIFTARGIFSHLVSPDTAVGLTCTHLDRIEDALVPC